MTKEFFIKYFRGELSTSEEKMLLDWIDLSAENRQEFLKERNLWDMLLFNSDASSLQLKSESPFVTSNKQITRKKWIHEFLKIAAVFVVALSIGYWLTTKQKEQTQAWNTIEVPIGQRVCLHLADSTKVWLNAKSRFSFPDKFKNNLREVKLDGEAVFDVAHQDQSSFVVKTKHFNVRVMGTKFNVYAYDNSSVFETALVRGKVLLEKLESNQKPVELKPDQMAIYQDGNEAFEIKNIDAKESIYWTDGVYSFNNQPLSLIIQRLERYYEVKITVKYPEFLNHTFTGKFRYSDPIEVLLQVIKKSTSFNYSKKGNEITIIK